VIRALVHVGKLLARGDVDARGVTGERDLLRQEGAIVRGVVPRQAALVEAILPDGERELHGLHGVLAVEHHGASVLLDLEAAPHPRNRVRPRVRIVDRMSERLTEGLALGLEGPADLPKLVPGLRKLEAGLLEPVLAVRHGPRHDELWYADPAAVR